MKNLKVIFVLGCLVVSCSNSNSDNKSSTSPLHEAALEGDINKVRELIASAFDVNTVVGEFKLEENSPFSYDNVTALHIAASIIGPKLATSVPPSDKHLEVVKALVAAGADVNATCNFTMMNSPSLRDGLTKLDLPISSEAPDDHVRDRGLTALHFAIDNGYLEMVEYLITAEADVNAEVSVFIDDELVSTKTPLELVSTKTPLGEDEVSNYTAIEQALRDAGATDTN